MEDTQSLSCSFALWSFSERGSCGLAGEL